MSLQDFYFLPLICFLFSKSLLVLYIIGYGKTKKYLLQISKCSFVLELEPLISARKQVKCSSPVLVVLSMPLEYVFSFFVVYSQVEQMATLSFTI